jgi:peptidyl-prolyl cis-trans isomerase B (cyclophilin B)
LNIEHQTIRLQTIPFPYFCGTQKDVMKKILFLFVFLSISLFHSCAQKGAKGPTDFVVTIHTGHGDMVAVLYDETPKHKANFLKLAKEGYFDGMLFHRVIQGFMIQGGDPDSKTATLGQQLGGGGPGYEIDAEFNPKFFHVKGALSAARMGDQVNPEKKSSGSQFYIVQGQVASPEQVRYDVVKLNTALGQLFPDPSYKPFFDSLLAMRNANNVTGYNEKLFGSVPRVEKATGMTIQRPDEAVEAYSTKGGAPHLDGEYTVFGMVIGGLDVIDKIAAEPTSSERPVNDIKMTVEVEEVPRAEITKKYSYQYPK